MSPTPNVDGVAAAETRERTTVVSIDGGSGRACAYVVEETVLPADRLRASDAALAASLRAALAEHPPGTCTAEFLRHLLRAAGRDAELALLPAPSASDAVFGLFGSAVVRPEQAVVLQRLPKAVSVRGLFTCEH